MKVGFHIWAGYSQQPNTTWKHIADAFVDALGDPEKMKPFKNTWLAESFEEESIKLSTNDLKDNIEDYIHIQNDAKIVLMTIDTQNDRLEYLIKAWCKGETSYNLRAGKIMGDPDNKNVWEELNKILNTPLYTTDGREVKIFKAFIDMGGGKTDAVKKFARQSSKIIMLKGDDKEAKSNDSRPLAVLKNSQNDGDLIMWVATNKAKDIVFERLALQPHEFGSIHHNITFDDEWFAQLTSEKKIFKKNKRGFLEKTYIKTRDRNEALDLEAYQVAAIKVIQDQFPKLDLSVKVEE